ncbi:MAG TPA: DUF3857 domain-containing protein [Puia sp.]|jgi:hypothetical protein|nr:DUF3857 domain-containing protein [Puia sp.]
MKKHYFLCICFLASMQLLFSQPKEIQTEKWDENPIIHSIDKKYNKESAVIISDNRRLEFVDESKTQVALYYTQHKIVHVNDDRGIEVFNKIYLGITESTEIIDVKARTILPGGKILELDKNNIKDIQEGGNSYKIFAMEGVEKGAEIEYYYTFKRPTSYFGRDILQSRFPVLATCYELIAPERLKFDIKSFNCSPTGTDTLKKEKRIIHRELSDVSGAENEKYASYDVNLMRLEYKLSYNNLTQKDQRLFTWNDLAKRINGLYTNYSEKESKKISELSKANGWASLDDEPAKIMAVENFLKKNFAVKEELRSDEANKVEKILQSKVTGVTGIMRLFGAIYFELGIDYQFVLAGDRDAILIDRQFENWNSCEYPLVYFPAETKFIAPTKPEFRYPWIPPLWGAANGLFCKRTTIGNFATAIGEIKPIELEDYRKTFNNIESKIELNKTFDSLVFDVRQIYSGYTAPMFRKAFNFTNAEQSQRNIKQLSKSVTSSENMLSSEIENLDFENENANVPFVLHTKAKSSELLEKAGNKLLVKIGLAIGPQVEMYQEKTRQLPIKIDYGHFEERKIDFTIPDGYVIKNLEDLKIEQVFKDKEEITMQFVSSYTIKDNVLSIHIMEDYRKTFYPLSQFEEFKKIINASSDFNKVILVLEKK